MSGDRAKYKMYRNKICTLTRISKQQYYIENNTWSRGDMEFIFECSHRYRTSERSERVRYQMGTREDKFHISKRPCIILFII